MITVHDDEEEGENIQEDEGKKSEDRVFLEDSPRLSIHALEGTYNYQIMRLRGSVGKRMLCILIDSGSKHNFIDVRMATKLGCVMELIFELKVVIANGSELRCTKVCKGFS